MNNLYGVNVRTLGISRDQALPVIRQLAPAFTLCHDDPELAALVQAAGVRAIYRQTGDEDLSVNVAAFIGERAKNAPPGALIHAVNGRGLSPALAQREIECMKAADAIGRKCCIINAATHQSAADWQTMRPAIEYAVAHGHIIGVHVYLDGKLDQYAWEFVPLMQEYGGTWVLTEFAPIADIRDPFTGWRGFTSAAAVADWIRGITPTLKRLNLPACWFSLDHWQPNDYGREKGFGMYGIAEIIDAMVSANATAQWSEPMTQQTPGKQATMAITANLRPSPSTQQAALARIPQGATVTVWPEPVTNADGYEWVRAEYSGQAGYVVRTWNGAPAFTLAAEPEPPTDAVCSEALTDDEIAQLIAHHTGIAGIYRALWERRQAA